jgi:hypothetical protein
MHCPQADRSMVEIKRTENGIGLLQNEAMYLEDIMKITQTD